MADDLTLLEDWAGVLLSRLSPTGRRKAAKAIATALRASQQRRIAQQQNPDGSPYTPRKRQPGKLRGKRGRLKRAAMFTKLRGSAYLKAHADADKATVDFTGRAAGIAAVHQDGRTDKVNKHGTVVRYPRRILLGFSAEDVATIREIAIEHLGK